MATRSLFGKDVTIPHGCITDTAEQHRRLETLHWQTGLYPQVSAWPPRLPAGGEATVTQPTGETELTGFSILGTEATYSSLNVRGTCRGTGQAPATVGALWKGVGNTAHMGHVLCPPCGKSRKHWLYQMSETESECRSATTYWTEHRRSDLTTTWPRLG